MAFEIELTIRQLQSIHIISLFRVFMNVINPFLWKSMFNSSKHFVKVIGLGNLLLMKVRVPYSCYRSHCCQMLV